MSFIIIKILYSEHQESSNRDDLLVDFLNSMVNCLHLTIIFLRSLLGSFYSIRFSRGR